MTAPDNLPVAEIVHSMPGRSRLRIADRRGDSAFFASVATTLSSMAGVGKVEVTPLTGSVLIQHGGPIAHIGIAARDAGLFTVGEAPPVTAEAPAIEFDPKLLMVAGLIGAALWQISRERVFPPAITLLWYAMHMGGFAAPGDDGE